MKQIKFTGIVLKSLDYKEKDKLLTIFSLELGKLTAALRGVNQQKSKLKFAAMPFCFAQFVASAKGDYLTITEVYQIESFYNIVSNYEKSIVGFLMLEIACIIIHKEPNEEWFLFLVKCLKELEYSKTNEKVVEIKFILHTLKGVGYGLNFEVCSKCNLKFMNDTYINLDVGELECSTCYNAYSVKLDKQHFNILRLINLTEIDKLGSLKFSGAALKSIADTLIKNLNLRLGVKLKSIF